jgi:hypothetical protein
MYINNENNSWLVEYCPICGSANHIFIPPEVWEVDGWECWSCFNRWWMDDLAKTTLMMAWDVDEDEAEEMLKNGTAKLLHGKFERDLE